MKKTKDSKCHKAMKYPELSGTTIEVHVNCYNHYGKLFGSILPKLIICKTCDPANSLLD